jgi:hypothetical protein
MSAPRYLGMRCRAVHSATVQEALPRGAFVTRAPEAPLKPTAGPVKPKPSAAAFIFGRYFQILSKLP